MSLCDPVHDELAPRRVCLWACRGAHTLLVAANVGKNGTGDCARDSHSQTRTKKESSKEISMMPLGPLGERGNQAHDHSQPRKHSFTRVHCTPQTAVRKLQTPLPRTMAGLRHVSRHAAYTPNILQSNIQEQQNMNDNFCAAWNIFRIKAQQLL